MVLNAVIFQGPVFLQLICYFICNFRAIFKTALLRPWFLFSEYIKYYVIGGAFSLKIHNIVSKSSLFNKLYTFFNSYFFF